MQQTACPAASGAGAEGAAWFTDTTCRAWVHSAPLCQQKQTQTLQKGHEIQVLRPSGVPKTKFGQTEFLLTKTKKTKWTRKTSQQARVGRDDKQRQTAKSSQPLCGMLNAQWNGKSVSDRGRTPTATRHAAVSDGPETGEPHRPGGLHWRPGRPARTEQKPGAKQRGPCECLKATAKFEKKSKNISK